MEIVVALGLGLVVVVWALSRIAGKQPQGPPPLTGLERTRELVDHATAALATVPIPTKEEFWDQALKEIDFTGGVSEDHLPVFDLFKGIRDLIRTLYLVEGFDPKVEPPLIEDGLEGARYRDRLRAKLEKTSATNITLLRTAIVESVQYFLHAIPSIAFLPSEEVKAQASKKTLEGFAIPLLSTIQDAGELVTNIIAPFYTPDAVRSELFYHVRLIYERNVYAMSGAAWPSSPKSNPRLTYPVDHKGTAQEIVDGYLRGLPFKKLLEVKVPFRIPSLTRFEHHWIVSPTGTGKTNTLSLFIHSDLAKVAAGQASLIVMESTRTLIKTIEGLAYFGPGGELEGKLIVIDAEDVEYPCAINLFDIGLAEINKASPRDREALLNSAVSMLEYVFRALLGAELTSRQSTLFNFTIQLLIHIPNATLDTFLDLLQPGAIRRYARYLDMLDSDAKAFFRLKFDNSPDEYRQTKQQVADRIFAIRRIRSLSRMFSAKKTRLNLFDEMGKGRVILINAAKSLLQEDGVEVFGRFWLAMILLAAEKRQLLSQTELMPTYVYIDECQDIVRRDEKLPVILDQARKFKVGMVLAHQRLDQMSPPVLNALYGSAAIKFATQLSDANAAAMARNMGTTPEFIAAQPQYHYAVSIRGYAPQATSLKIPESELGRVPRMSAKDAQAARDEMRKRYAILGETEPSETSEYVEAEPVEEVIPPEGGSKPRRRYKPRGEPQDAQDVKAEVLSITDKRRPDAPSDW